MLATSWPCCVHIRSCICFCNVKENIKTSDLTQKKKSELSIMPCSVNGVNESACTSIRCTKIAWHHLRHHLDMVSGSLKFCVLFLSKLSGAPRAPSQSNKQIITQNSLGHGDMTTEMNYKQKQWSDRDWMEAKNKQTGETTRKNLDKTQKVSGSWLVHTRDQDDNNRWKNNITCKTK